MAVRVRRIVACFDGTWNTDKSNTNVSRLFRLIANETTGCPEQRHFYDEGVGTKLGERISGGMLGMGLDGNIRQGYAWLGSQFALAATSDVDDDKFLIGPDIFLFGFSRGAFTARSLGGLINYLGLPKLGSKRARPARQVAARRHRRARPRGACTRRGPAKTIATPSRRAEPTRRSSSAFSRSRRCSGPDIARTTRTTRYASTSSACGTRWARSAFRACSTTGPSCGRRASTASMTPSSAAVCASRITRWPSTNSASPIA